jgi:2-iminobutanoate/2-iminopropanoate deaminase
MTTMPRRTVDAPGAPAALGPYSHANVANGFLFTSGQIGLDPETGELVGPDIVAQTRRVLDNIRAIVEAGGSRLDSVVRVTVYLVDMADFPAMNEIYGDYFPEDPPARVCIEAKALPKGARLEMEAVAVLS